MSNISSSDQMKRNTNLESQSQYQLVKKINYFIQQAKLQWLIKKDR